MTSKNKPVQHRRKMKNKGFTLIEVIIAMMIMAMLTVLISRSIRSAIRNKDKLEAYIASETLLYDCLAILKQDIERAFHYRDIFFEMETKALKKLEARTNPNRQSSEARKPPVKLTHFLGESDNLHFTTLNHFRTRYNAQESDQMEVGYYLENCKKQDGKGSSQCLWRRSSVQIDNQVERGGSHRVIAENITHFKLSYHSDREEDQWVDQWRSDGNGRGDQQNRFPNLVKIELKIEDKDNPKFRKAEQSVVVRIQFPNNPNPQNLQVENPSGRGQQ